MNYEAGRSNSLELG